MRYKKLGDSYVIRLEKGEKIIEKLEEFCMREGVKSGHFSGIGGLSEVEIAHFSIKDKDYHSKVFRGSVLELISLQGNVTLSEGKVKVHAHVMIGDSGFKTFGGHLVEGTILPTCEIVFVPFGEEIERKTDEETGLALLDL